MRRSVGVIVVALVASMTMAGMALAEDGEETTEREMLDYVRVEVLEEDVEGETVTTVYVALVSGDMPADCPPVEDPADGDGDDAVVPGDIEEGGEDGDGVVEDEPVVYAAGDCIEWVVDHPSGKTHHGAIVSTIAKNVHPSMLDGIKKGEIMRCVAKYGKDDGKDCTMPVVDGEGADGGDGDGDDGGEEPEVELDKADKPGKGKSENARNKDKPNKGKKNG